MQFLKQSTAFTETIGPILDSAGAEYTGAVIGDLSISKNGTEAAMASAATLTHVSNGHYTLVGTTGNSDTLGRVTIRCNKATYQVPVKEYMVLPATVYDALVTNAAGGANGLPLFGSAMGITAGAIVSASFGAGATIPRCTLVDTCTANTDMRGTDGAALASVWTLTRGGYIDNLSAGAVMLASSYLTAAQLIRLSERGYI